MDTGGVERVGVPHRRRRAAGHALLDVEPADELRRADRLPDDAVVERAVRHRRGRRVAGEVPASSRIRHRYCRRNCLTEADERAFRPAVAVDPRTARTSLMFRPGDKVSATSTTTPRRDSRGSKSDAPDTAGRAQRALRRSCRRCSTPTARSGDTRSVLLVLQGMDTAGKGGIVKHVVGGAIRKAFGTPASASRPRRSWRTTTCGGSARRCRPPGISACSTDPTTRTC